MDEMRFKLLRVTPELIVSMCKTGRRGPLDVSGLPEDARVVRTYVSEARTVCIVVESQEFPATNEGDRYEDVVVSVTKHAEAAETE